MAVRKTKNGYRAEVYLGIDPLTGKKIRKTKSFKLMKDAKAWEVKILQSYKDGTLNLNNNMTLSEYLDYWYETYVVVNTKVSTQKRYKSLVNKIKKNLGHIRLDKLKTPHIDKFYADLSLEKNKKGSKKYSNTTILKYHKLLNQSIERAIGWELLVRNPAKYASPPGEDTKKIDTWPIDQVKNFLENIKETETYQIYYPTLIAFHTGLRVGEICGLR